MVIRLDHLRNPFQPAVEEEILRQEQYLAAGLAEHRVGQPAPGAAANDFRFGKQFDLLGETQFTRLNQRPTEAGKKIVDF